MDISATNSAYNTTTSNTAISSEDNTTLTMNDFFKLLSAQLQNQNMFEPVDNTEFIAQMAQFSTLSQIQELKSTFQMTYAVSLIGKNVEVKESNENGITTIVSGVVDKVSYESGLPYLSIGGVSYPATDVLEIKNSTETDI